MSTPAGNPAISASTDAEPVAKRVKSMLETENGVVRAGRRSLLSPSDTKALKSGKDAPMVFLPGTNEALTPASVAKLVTNLKRPQRQEHNPPNMKQIKKSKKQKPSNKSF